MGGAEWELLRGVASGLSVTLLLVIVIAALGRGVIVTRQHHDASVAAEREKTALLRAELEKREGLYIASLAEIKGQLVHTNEARERVLTQLEENNKQMYRFADALVDLKDALRASAPR